MLVPVWVSTGRPGVGVYGVGAGLFGLGGAGTITVVEVGGWVPGLLLGLCVGGTSISYVGT
jgi:hypothetical protein